MADDPPVLLLLDTSAVLAYVRESLHVGEPMSEVADDGGAVGIPLPCLIEAAAVGDDPTRLRLLATNPSVTILGEDPAAWEFVAAAYELVGRYDAAQAGAMALDLGVPVLTAQPGLYAGLAGGDLVVEIPR